MIFDHREKNKKHKGYFFLPNNNRLSGCIFVLISGESNSATGEPPIDDIFFMLHPSLRPIPPCPTSQVSMRVYEEHRKVMVNVKMDLAWIENVICIIKRWRKNI